MWRLVAALTVCLAACGDNQLGPPEVAVDAGPWQIAPHAPLPAVFPHSSVVLSAMQLVTVTYQGYDASELLRFGDAMVASSWYRSIGLEYGVAPASSVQHIVLPAPTGPLGRSDIAAQMIDLVSHDPDVVKPTADKNQVLYLLYVPPGVGRGAGLAGLHGYHEMLVAPGAPAATALRFPIAVVLDDGDLGSATMQTAHQVIDAVTNPYAPPNDGWYADPPKTDPWCLLHREIADLCEGEAAFPEGEFSYPRVYSNEATSVGMPPCAPPMAGDSWSDVTAEPSQIQSVPVNGEVRFRLTGWSTSPLADWKLFVRAADTSDLSIDDMDPRLSPSDVINNGAALTLTLRAPPDSVGATGAVEILSGTNQHPWAVAFVVRQ